MHIMTSLMTFDYNFLEMALSYMIYIINDVIMSNTIIHYPIIYFLTKI